MTLMPVENIEKAKIHETGKANKLGDQDRAFHDWYRFILSFPPHLVRDYIHDFGLDNQSVVLDPFCGTGTTLVESKISDISSLGIEANAFTHFATAVKINWEIEPDLLWRHSCEIAKKVLDRLGKQGINDQEPFDGDVSTLPLRQLSAEQNQLILTDSYRTPLPLAIIKTAPEGYEWIIRPASRAQYQFVLTKAASFLANPNLTKTKIPDATPGIVSEYSLLAKIRYNRLIDIFTGVTCYSLQNHLRTTLSKIGQVETDEIYVGIDQQGVHYVFPIYQ